MTGGLPGNTQETMPCLIDDAEGMAAWNSESHLILNFINKQDMIKK